MTMLMGEETIICLACRSEDPTHYLWHFGAGLNSTLGGSLLKSGPGFLYHPKKTKPDFKWQSAGYLTFKVDLHRLPLTEFLTPTLMPGAGCLTAAGCQISPLSLS